MIRLRINRLITAPDGLPNAGIHLATSVMMSCFCHPFGRARIRPGAISSFNLSSNLSFGTLSRPKAIGYELEEGLKNRLSH
ncbi:MAG: hypothetical protein LBF22_07740 [Deltaproteobacteria bacterium]|nr:hypothetical protein [Deltaproteobacteria bacterium]